jgi:hypothetical protein
MGNRFLVPNTTDKGLTLLSSTSLSGSSITFSSIPLIYRDLELVIRSFKPAGDGDYLWMRLNGDSNTRYRSLSTTATNQTFDSTIMQLSEGNDNSVATGLIVSTIYDYTNTETWKMQTNFAITVNQGTTTNFNYRTLGAFYNQTQAITSITLGQTGVNFTSGTAFLYGVR